MLESDPVDSFDRLSDRLDLKIYLRSKLGTLYFVPSSATGPRVMVRRFDADLGPELVVPFVGLIEACQRWIERYPAVAGLARIEQITEFGSDYAVRPFHTIVASTQSYTDAEKPAEAPDEYEQLLSALSREIGRSDSAQDKLCETVLRRSFLEATPKTYFNIYEERFIAVEPELSADEVRGWGSLHQR